MPDLIDTTEMYLRTIYELLEEGIVPMRARIVERLGLAGPTVSQTVSRMERDGLLVLDDDRSLHLTDEGLCRAAAVMRRHRLAEVMLVETLGVDMADAHDEACRWEHAMTNDVTSRMEAFLEQPDTSPYGNPVPPDVAARTPHPEVFRQGRRTVRDAVAAGVSTGVVTALAEWVQADRRLLDGLVEGGITPGATISMATREGGVRLGVEGAGGRVVGPHTAEGIYLEA